MAEPRAITTTMEWRAVKRINPVMCMCGHLHYARQEWTWCEQEGCECPGLCE